MDWLIQEAAKDRVNAEEAAMGGGEKEEGGGLSDEEEAGAGATEERAPQTLSGDDGLGDGVRSGEEAGGARSQEEGGERVLQSGRRCGSLQPTETHVYLLEAAGWAQHSKMKR